MLPFTFLDNALILIYVVEKEIVMRKSHLTISQIVAVLHAVEFGGKTVAGVCRDARITQYCYYRWKAKYGRMDARDLHKLMDLDEENQHLRRIYVDLYSDCQLLRASIKK